MGSSDRQEKSVSAVTNKTARKKPAAGNSPNGQVGAKKAPPRKAAAKASAKKASVKKTPPKKATAKKATAKKSTAKKSTAKKATAKKSTAKKSTARKATAKKATAKNATAKKATTKKSTARKAAAKKSTSKKTTARKTTAKKAASKSAVSTTAKKKTASRSAKSKATASSRSAKARVLTAIGGSMTEHTAVAGAAVVHLVPATQDQFSVFTAGPNPSRRTCPIDQSQPLTLKDSGFGDTFECTAFLPQDMPRRLVVQGAPGSTLALCGNRRDWICEQATDGKSIVLCPTACAQRAADGDATVPIHLIDGVSTFVFRDVSLSTAAMLRSSEMTDHPVVSADTCTITESLESGATIATLTVDSSRFVGTPRLSVVGGGTRPLVDAILNEPDGQFAVACETNDPGVKSTGLRLSPLGLIKTPKHRARQQVWGISNTRSYAQVATLTCVKDGTSRLVCVGPHSESFITAPGTASFSMSFEGVEVSTVAPGKNAFCRTDTVPGPHDIITINGDRIVVADGKSINASDAIEFNVMVRAADDAGNVFDETLSFATESVSRAVGHLTLSNDVAEFGAEGGTVVGTLHTEDASNDEHLSFELVGGGRQTLIEALTSDPDAAPAVPYAGGDRGLKSTGLRLAFEGNLTIDDETSGTVWRVRNVRDEVSTCTLEEVSGTESLSIDAPARSECFVFMNGSGSYRLKSGSTAVQTAKSTTSKFKRLDVVPAANPNFAIVGRDVVVRDGVTLGERRRGSHTLIVRITDDRTDAAPVDANFNIQVGAKQTCPAGIALSTRTVVAEGGPGRIVGTLDAVDASGAVIGDDVTFRVMGGVQQPILEAFTQDPQGCFIVPGKGPDEGTAGSGVKLSSHGSIKAGDQAATVWCVKNTANESRTVELCAKTAGGATRRLTIPPISDAYVTMPQTGAHQLWLRDQDLDVLVESKSPAKGACKLAFEVDAPSAFFTVSGHKLCLTEDIAGGAFKPGLHAVVVQATTASGASFEQMLVIEATLAHDDTPASTIELSNSTIAVNASAGDVIATIGCTSDACEAFSEGAVFTVEGGANAPLERVLSDQPDNCVTASYQGSDPGVASTGLRLVSEGRLAVDGKSERAVWRLRNVNACCTVVSIESIGGGESRQLALEPSCDTWITTSDTSVCCLSTGGIPLQYQASTATPFACDAMVTLKQAIFEVNGSSLQIAALTQFTEESHGCYDLVLCATATSNPLVTVREQFELTCGPIPVACPVETTSSAATEASSPTVESEAGDSLVAEQVNTSAATNAGSNDSSNELVSFPSTPVRRLRMEHSWLVRSSCTTPLSERL